MYQGDFDLRRASLYGRTESYVPELLGLYGERSITGSATAPQGEDAGKYDVTLKDAGSKKPYYFDSKEKKVYRLLGEMELATGISKKIITKQMLSKSKSKRFFRSFVRSDFPYAPPGAPSRPILDAKTGEFYESVLKCSKAVNYSESNVRGHLGKQKKSKVIRFYYADLLDANKAKKLMAEYDEKTLLIGDPKKYWVTKE